MVIARIAIMMKNATRLLTNPQERFFMRVRLRHKRRVIIDISVEEATQLAGELVEWEPDDLGSLGQRLLTELNDILPWLDEL